MICAGDISGGTKDISARIFRRQRRETEDISILEYELSSVAGILCVTVRPERTPRKISFGGRSGHMAEDQAAGVPPAAETTILALGAGRRPTRASCSPRWLSGTRS